MTERCLAWDRRRWTCARDAWRRILELLVPAGAQAPGYRIAPGAAAEAGNAGDAAQTMADNRWSVLVEGTASKDAASIAFAWGVGSSTEYSHCEVAEPVPDGGEATTVITIHADHLFADDLDSEEPNIAFELVAASDADMDGTVTAEELRARDISQESRYQVGNLEEITNLWDFMTVLAGRLGHIDGEGHCEF